MPAERLSTVPHLLRPPHSGPPSTWATRRIWVDFAGHVDFAKSPPSSRVAPTAYTRSPPPPWASRSTPPRLGRWGLARWLGRGLSRNRSDGHVPLAEKGLPTYLRSILATPQPPHTRSRPRTRPGTSQYGRADCAAPADFSAEGHAGTGPSPSDVDECRRRHYEATSGGGLLLSDVDETRRWAEPRRGARETERGVCVCRQLCVRPTSSQLWGCSTGRRSREASADGRSHTM